VARARFMARSRTESIDSNPFILGAFAFFIRQQRLLNGERVLLKNKNSLAKEEILLLGVKIDAHNKSTKNGNADT